MHTIKRMVELSKKINLKIRLVYYPPYHSKYNPIERCWAALENYWHGTILDSVDAAIIDCKNPPLHQLRRCITVSTFMNKINFC